MPPLSIHEDPVEEIYKSDNPLIPTGLTKTFGTVYETILNFVDERGCNSGRAPHVVVITDLAKDYDDIIAMLVLKELARLGVIILDGFVANLMPSEKRARFGRGALDVLGLQNIPIAQGSVGSQEHHGEMEYEFDGAETFMAPEGTEFEDGQDFLYRICTEAVSKGYKITLLTISSLMDIGNFAKNHPELLRNAISNVVLQGGYEVIDGVLTANDDAANNHFDYQSAQSFHKFIQDHKIPSLCFTKVSAFSTPIYNSFLATLANTGVNLGVYLRKCQIGQELEFYKSACGPVEGRFRPFMSKSWFINVKTTWNEAPHDPGESPPLGAGIIPWLGKVIAYDCLAALGAGGQDLLDALGVSAPLTKRPELNHSIHKVVGVPEVKENGVVVKPEDRNLHGDKFAIVIKALVLGSLLSIDHDTPKNSFLKLV